MLQLCMNYLQSENRADYPCVQTRIRQLVKYHVLKRPKYVQCETKLLTICCHLTVCIAVQ